MAQASAAGAADIFRPDEDTTRLNGAGRMGRRSAKSVVDAIAGWDAPNL